MVTVNLNGKISGGVWRWEFNYDGSCDGRFVCKRNGSEDEEPKAAVLESMVEVVAPRVSEEGIVICSSDISDGMDGEFSFSGAEGRELTPAELEELKASLRNALTAFMDSEPEAGREIVENAWMSARARAAARKAREIVSRRRDAFDFPELPKRIRWAMPAPDIHAMRLDLLATFQAMESDRGLLSNVRKLQHNLQQTADARVMRNFRSNYDRVRELLDEKLRLRNLASRITLPGELEVHLGFVLLRGGRWRLELEICDFSSVAEASKLGLLSARIGQIPGLKCRRQERLWYVALGPINDLATFRKAAWPVYVRVYNALRAICLELYSN